MLLTIDLFSIYTILFEFNYATKIFITLTVSSFSLADKFFVLLPLFIWLLLILVATYLVFVPVKHVLLSLPPQVTLKKVAIITTHPLSNHFNEIEITLNGRTCIIHTDQACEQIKAGFYQYAHSSDEIQKLPFYSAKANILTILTKTVSFHLTNRDPHGKKPRQVPKALLIYLKDPSLLEKAAESPAN